MKRLIAVILTCLLLASLPATAFATDADAATEISYSFVLENGKYVIGEKQYFNGLSVDSSAASEAIAGFYEAGKLNWKLAVDSSNLIRNGGNSVRTVHFFGSTETYKWEGLRIGMKVASPGKEEYADNHWIAFTCKVPEPGYYDMTLQHMTRADGFSDTRIYVLDGTYEDAYSIETRLDQDALVGSVDYSSDTFDIVPAESAVGEVYVESEEFTVVFHAGIKEKDAQSYQYLRGFTLSNASAKAAAKETDERIADIDADKPSAKAVKDAEQAYKQLTPGQRFYVANYEKLQAAKIQLQRSQNNMLVAGIVAAVAVVAVGVILAVVLRKKKNKKQ